jgi:clan AA aspartic protease
MIVGRVDDYGRALAPVTVFNPLTAAIVTLEAWIDTGFTGGLSLTPGHIALLGLSRSSTVPGALADGSRVIFETFSCQVEWFGVRKAIEAIGSSGQFALIGVGLLEDATLFVDYPARTVTLTLSAGPQPAP